MASVALAATQISAVRCRAVTASSEIEFKFGGNTLPWQS